MLKFLFRTSWHHMSRMPYASIAVIFTLAILFTTCLTGVTMLGFLAQERHNIESRFTYHLALNPTYTFESQRVSDFAHSLVGAGLQDPIEYITREKALDREIERNPGILGVLEGENPLPDIIVVPLRGVNTDIFWQRIQEFRDLFEGGVNIENLRARLERFSQSLDEIVDIWRALIVFTGLAVVLMTMLMTAILRYHFRLFESERVVGRLVGADPVFIWGPHAITGVVYICVSAAISFGLFETLRSLF